MGLIDANKDSGQQHSIPKTVSANMNFSRVYTQLQTRAQLQRHNLMTVQQSQEHDANDSHSCVNGKSALS